MRENWKGSRPQRGRTFCLPTMNWTRTPDLHRAQPWFPSEGRLGVTPTQITCAVICQIAGAERSRSQLSCNFHRREQRVVSASKHMHRLDIKKKEVKKNQN